MKVGEAWVTLVRDDEACLEALILAESLRRTMTNRRIVALTGPSVSKSARHSLEKVFYAVIKLPKMLSGKEVKLEELPSIAKMYCWALSFSYKKCVFLDSRSLVLQNADELFSVNNIGHLEEGGTSVLALTPGLDEFESLEEKVRLAVDNGKSANLDKIIQDWIKTQKNVDILDAQYNFPVHLESQTLSEAAKPKIIKFISGHPIDITRKGGKLPSSDDPFTNNVLEYWNTLYTEAKASTQVNVERSLPTTKDTQHEPIAVVGMSCRFPGANSVAEFWEVLINGRDEMNPIPENRWTAAEGCFPTPEERAMPAGYLKCPVDAFDGKFFGMSPAELDYADPQQRLLLEVAWEALEDAAIPIPTLQSTQAGIFAGIWKMDYYDLMTESGFRLGEFYRSYMGNAFGATAGRLAFLLGVTGSNISTESGCSSSVVALGLAMKSLRAGETNVALAAGVNLILHPFSFETMKAVISPDGHCKTFDADANGFARAEGCGVLVLKRLSDAIRGNDRIYSLLRGYGEAQEGPSKSMGTPTVQCESMAMKLALDDAGVAPHEVDYVEAHGTGTAVGDPMEMEAITRVYSKGRTNPLLVGSVKTNVGHTEACSGITGLIKTILAMEHETVPPHINLKTLNPKIKLDKIPAEIPLEPRPWKKSQEKRRFAGISSYGITGTDAHVIIEEPPETHKAPKVTKLLQRPKDILTLSAKSDDALTNMVEKYSEFLSQNPSAKLSDVCYTANTGRTHFAHRIAIPVDSISDLKSKLSKKTFSKSQVQGNVAKICFLFTGQGSQYHNMGRQLYETNAIFQRSFDECEKIFREVYSIDVLKHLYCPQPSAELNRTLNSQSAIFAVEYGLIQMWKSWGVNPDMVLGHSFGEVVAAMCAGIMNLEDTILLVVERSKLIDSLPQGKMLAVRAGEKEVSEYIKKMTSETKGFWLDLATINNPEQTVVSGREDNIKAFAKYCESHKVRSLMLDANQGFHCRDMDPILPILMERLGPKIKFMPPHSNCEYISAVEGSTLDRQMDMSYWQKHTRHSVKFIDASKEVYNKGGRIFVEIGPQPILSALVMRNTDGVSEPVICLPSIKRREDEWVTMLNTLAKLYSLGVDIDFKGFYDYSHVSKIQLPFYPFQRKRFWFTPPKNKSVGGGSNQGKKLHPLVGGMFPNATTNKIFQNYVELGNEKHVFLKDHCVGKYCIYPGAGYLELVLGAAHAATLAAFEDFYPPLTPVVVENLMIASPMEVTEDGSEVQTVIDKGSEEDVQTGWVNVQVFSHQGSSSEAKKWVNHAAARFSPFYNNKTEERSLEDVRNKVGEKEETLSEFYDQLKKSGLNFGPIFYSLKSYRKSAGDPKKSQMLFTVDLPEGNGNFLCHPVIADAMVQALQIGTEDASSQQDKALRVPVSIGQFVWFAKGSENSTKNYINVFDGETGRVAILYDENGTKLAMMSGVQVISTTMQSITKSLEKQKQNLPMLFEDIWKATAPVVSPESLDSPQGKTPQWVVFATGTDLEKALVKKLEDAGRKVMRVWPALKYGHLNDNVVTVNPRAKEDILKVFKGDLKDTEVEGIIYLYGCMCEMELEQKVYTQGYLNILQTLLEFKSFPKLITVTKGVVYVGDQGSSLPHPATLWGMSKTLRSEHPNVFCKTVDIDPDSEQTPVDLIFNEIWTEDKDFQVAFRQGTRYIVRLTECASTISLHTLSLPNSERYALALPSTKTISDLKFVPAPLPNLTGSLVEIRVRAAGLNFKDVLNVIKPDAQFDNSNSVGADFSGVITRLGPQATRFKVGDSVLGCNFEGGALPSHICTWEDAVVPLPPKFTYSDGATLATAYATAYHCLVDIANVQRGETILVHTASGAVGIVAIQIAKVLGAEVIATAGSRRKRAFLKSMGVKHIFNSRNLDFGKGIQEVTSGKGVQMVLNSLTSAGFKETSLSSLAKNGRFVEMSKLNIWQPEEVLQLRKDVAYTIVDLSAATLETWKVLLAHMDKYLKEDKLKPVIYSRFDALNICNALTYLQKAKHVGKVVCVMPEMKLDEKSGNMDVKTALFNDRATYVITGGLGGIGLEVAQWMVELGARHVLLCGRNQPGQKAQDVMTKLNAVGINMQYFKMDVGNKEDCKRLMTHLKKENLPPLRGVSHAAGCLSDGLLAQQKWEKFEETFNGKVIGGWNLHELTLQEDFHLEHFVVYSSVAAVLGAMGQSNHSAGNAYLDSLVHYRYSLGLASTSVNWGQWGQVGVAAELEITGMTPFSPSQGLHALELVMKSQRLQTAVVDGDVAVWKLMFSWSTSYLQDISSGSGGGGSSDSPKMNVSSAHFWEDLDSASNEKREVVTKYIIQVLSCILKFDSTEELDVNQNFQDLGLDSLMMVELKNILQNLLGNKVTLTLSSITDCNTVCLLSDRLLELMYGTKDKVQKREERKQLIRSDSVLADHIRFDPKKVKNAVKDPSKVEVPLVTGATGNLAPYIVMELSQMKNIRKIYCIVRAKSKEAGRSRLEKNFEEKGILSSVDMKKVEILVGNIAEEQLGICDNDEYNRVASEVDGIFHSAVKSNHLEEYRQSEGNSTDIRSVNVVGTIRILEFAVAQKLKWVFHASTLLTVLKDRQKQSRLPETWPDISDFDEAANFGYAISKFVADKLVEVAVEERGIPAKVFRFPMIGGDEKEGRQNVGENHPFLKYLSYFLSGVMPDFVLPVQVLSVDTCARLSLKAFFAPNGPLGVYNVTNPHYNKEQDILDLAKSFGFDVKVVEFPEFCQKLTNDGEKSVLHMLAEFYLDEDRYERTVRESSFIDDWKKSPELYYRSEKMNSILGEKELLSSIQSSFDILKRDVNYAIKTGFFQKYT